MSHGWQLSHDYGRTLIKMILRNTKPLFKSELRPPPNELKRNYDLITNDDESLNKLTYASHKK